MFSVLITEEVLESEAKGEMGVLWNILFPKTNIKAYFESKMGASFFKP